MVVGGEVVTLKSIEESSGIVIAEMPIHVSSSFPIATWFITWTNQNKSIITCREIIIDVVGSNPLNFLLLSMMRA